MKSTHYIPALTLLLLAGCGGSADTSLPKRELFVVNGSGDDGRFFLDGVRFDDVDVSEPFGPFSLQSDDLSISYQGVSETTPADQTIPAGFGTFILFDANYAASIVPFTRRYVIRQLPNPPASGVQLFAYGELIPEPLRDYRGPIDLYLLAPGQRPSDGVPFATNVTLQLETPYVQNLAAATGKWVIWATRPGSPANTLFKTVQLERKDGTTIMLQSSTEYAAIFLDHH
jgi:hypothetical protein